jgi:apolipoprotein D and lipocalin family protein
MNKYLFAALTIVCGVFFVGCSGLPDGVKPVDDFSVTRYQGTWYEVARLDHSFERGLSNVTAVYSLNDDGSVKVINKGFNDEEGQWSEAQGKAKFVGASDVGHLEVSFFGPFYSSYVVFKMDQQDYQYAFVSGFNTDYLWLLSRTPTVSQAIKDDFIATAKKHGFDTSSLIWVAHTPTPKR